MNLAALWSHERARVCAHLTEPAPAPGSHQPLHGSDGRHHDAHAARLLKRHSSNSAIANAAASSPSAAGAAATTKKKPSVSVKRESVFRRLLDESALPLAEAAMAVQQLYDTNEFAMEYADRAPNRFVQQQIPPPSLLATAAGAALNESTPGATGNDTTKPQLRKRQSNGLAPMNSTTPPPPPAALVSVPSHVRTSSISSPSPAAKASLPGGAGGMRRNPRKRGGGNGSSLELSAQAFKPYVGDLFSTRGDYVDGMLYMSRMKRSHQLTFGHDGFPTAAAATSDYGSRNFLKDAVADALSAAVAATAAGTFKHNEHATTGASSSSAAGLALAAAACVGGGGANVAGLSEISSEELLQIKQRQRCSLTLSNWSSNPENARLMVQENVVRALILLCKASDGDRVTKLHCVTTLMNLSHVDELRSELVQQGAVKTLVEIANEEAEDDKTLRTACAVTLCNLCCCLEGEEAILVEDGAVSALSLLINEHPKTAKICLGALFNLTCVKEPFHKIESVLKVFLTLASSSSPSSSPSSSSPAAVERDEILAKAICNLSNFKRVRLRLMEEGIVSAVANLIHPGHSKIQQLLAYVLLNLSAMRACRSELVAKGCLGALIALTGATPPQDTDAKCLIALALWNLSKEHGNRLRMVFEGLLLLVNELCRGVPTSSSSSLTSNGETLRAVCARTVYNVSCSEETRLKLVERDGVNVISSLSQKCHAEDGKKMCTLALCNLLSVPQAASDIVHAGAITSLIELSMVASPPQTLETRHLFAKALYGLCEIQATRAAVVHAGVIHAIVYLSSVSITASAAVARQAGLVSEIRARCTAALTCLAADDAIASYVCTPDVVRCVTQILVQERFNIAIERFCCSCLSLLCREEQCSRVVAEEGAIQAVLSTCLESQDMDTKASCCHVLASMSCHPSCCMALVEMGVLAVLTTLAKTTGNATTSKGAGAMTQRCCAITLANLSADGEIRPILVKSSIVPLLALLSNTYSEDSQRDCAKVLCNLSSVPGYESALVREGALSVLMMVGMVRALQPATKETCVRAFANLLTQETVGAMIAEGIVKVLPAFAGLAAAAVAVGDANNSTVAEVVSVLYGKLLSHREGRHALYGERAALRSLVALRPPHKDDDGTDGDESDAHSHDDSLYEKLLCELVFDDELRERSVEAGVVEALHQLAMMRASPSSSSPSTTHTSITRIARMLFVLAKHATTRQAAASPSSLATLTGFLTTLERLRPSTSADGDDQVFILYSVSTLCHLAWHDETRERLDPHSITPPLTQLLRLSPAEGDQHIYSSSSANVVHMSLLTLCCLSHTNDHLQAMLDGGILAYLCEIISRNHNDHPPAAPAVLPLVSILFRQLSLTPAFVQFLMRGVASTTIAIKLLCLVAHAVAEARDPSAALDCADALCSITFVSAVSHDPNNSVAKRSVPFVRRQSQPQLALRGSMTTTSSVPPAALVSSEVLAAIQALAPTAEPLSSLHPHQCAETRWRCMAALYAFSCIVDYRATLVNLGCTRLLVDQAASAAATMMAAAPPATSSRHGNDDAATASSLAVDLATLRCCAGTLCNLTIVSGTRADVNAATMVDEGAVPALIKLAKLENDEIREYCTLALSNLSSQSPKVESGAVSALLALSLSSHGDHSGGSGGSSSSRGPHVSSTQVGVARPPPVVDTRYKELATLPDFTMEREPLGDILTRKYGAAQGHASKPPPPQQLPAISAELTMVGGRQPHQMAAGTTDTSLPDGVAMTQEEAIVWRRKSSSIGDLLRVSSPTTTPLPRSSSSSRGEGGTADSELRGWPTMAFPKMDPVESRALAMGMDSCEVDHMDGANGHHHLRISGASSSAADNKHGTSGTTTSSSHVDGSNGGGGVRQAGDAHCESDDAHTSTSHAKVKSKFGGGNGLSPLARVVLRKTGTSNAVNKLKGGMLRNGGGGGGLGHTGLSSSSSSSPLPLATVQEAQETSTSTAPAPLRNSTTATNGGLHLRQGSLVKSVLPHRTGSHKTLLDSLSPMDAAPRAMADQTTTTTMIGAVEIAEQEHEGDSYQVSDASIAATAAAAHLYSMGPPPPTSPASSSSIVRTANSKPRMKTNPTAKTTTTKKAKKRLGEPARRRRSPLGNDEEVVDQDGDDLLDLLLSPRPLLVTSIEEMPTRAKLLGLWS